MFEVRNETEIWYKAKEMPDWIHYGSLFVAEPIEKEKYAVKRFDLEKGEYLLYTDCKTYFYNGVEYSVTDGCFTVSKPKKNLQCISQMTQNLPLWKCRRICMNNRNRAI